MENIKDESTLGVVRISDEVVSVIASIAAEEIQGIVEIPTGVGNNISQILKGKKTTTGKSVKVRIPFHLNPAVNSVHKKINLYATVSGRHKGANHYLTRFICTEIKGRHGDVCFCIFNHINPFKKGI